MSTLNQIIFTLKNSADRGTATRAQSLSNRQLEQYIHVTRAFLISKDLEKNNSVPVALLQDLGCWNLQEVDAGNCPEYLWGTEVKMAVFPPILELKENMGLGYFGLINKRTRIYVPASNYGSLDDYSRFKPKRSRIGYMVGNNTIYITGEGVEKLCTVNIQGIFKDPTLTSFYSAEGIEYCYDKDKDQYPITGDLERSLYQMIFSDYVIPFAQAPRQQENNESNKQLV